MSDYPTGSDLLGWRLGPGPSTIKYDGYKIEPAPEKPKSLWARLRNCLTRLGFRTK